MGRKPRVEFNGAIYHVIKRGNNREYIFRADADKESLQKPSKSHPTSKSHQVPATSKSHPKAQKPSGA